ncbi:TetR/AcrR family transcriptional regulator [Microbacterium esteraromaticum]|uniref:TetR/AcrR family transcriptional regulator n=1 Tax=Microbacterium esteraromaticum TaxID=57043 RepID=UPI001A8CD577|nr:TetR/AcrR family transcriptional regulator [Microbacterium esteraromaticum]MBN8425264.1 TetR/AcrR family transcriptional regulator [Microbacterium esteraromaticum]
MARPTSSTSRPRRSRDDWIDIAIDFGSRVGFDQLAIEPLAAFAGATKGSLYWHFADRAALIDAVLDRWEQRATREVIDALDPTAPDAAAALLARTVGHAHDATELRMLLASADARVGPVVARVHATRLAFLERILTGRGMPPADASARARLVYAAYLGGLLLNDDPDALRETMLRALET